MIPTSLGLRVIVFILLYENVAGGNKYFYKYIDGEIDVYYGPRARWGYREVKPPKSYKPKFGNRGDRPGICDNGDFICKDSYPTHETEHFQCEVDYQCPRFFKCCQPRCFRHKICQPATLNDEFTASSQYSPTRSSTEPISRSTTFTITSTTPIADVPAEIHSSSTSVETTTITRKPSGSTTTLSTSSISTKEPSSITSKTTKSPSVPIRYFPSTSTISLSSTTTLKPLTTLATDTRPTNKSTTSSASSTTTTTNSRTNEPITSAPSPTTDYLTTNSTLKPLVTLTPGKISTKKSTTFSATSKTTTKPRTTATSTYAPSTTTDYITTKSTLKPLATLTPAIIPTKKSTTFFATPKATKSRTTAPGIYVSSTTADSVTRTSTLKPLTTLTPGMIFTKKSTILSATSKITTKSRTTAPITYAPPILTDSVITKSTSKPLTTLAPSKSDLTSAISSEIVTSVITTHDALEAVTPRTGKTTKDLGKITTVDDTSDDEDLTYSGSGDGDDYDFYVDEDLTFSGDGLDGNIKLPMKSLEFRGKSTPKTTPASKNSVSSDMSVTEEHNEEDDGFSFGVNEESLPITFSGDGFDKNIKLPIKSLEFRGKSTTKTTPASKNPEPSEISVTEEHNEEDDGFSFGVNEESLPTKIKLTTKSSKSTKGPGDNVSTTVPKENVPGKTVLFTTSTKQASKTPSGKHRSTTSTPTKPIEEKIQSTEGDHISTNDSRNLSTLKPTHLPKPTISETANDNILFVHQQLESLRKIPATIEKASRAKADRYFGVFSELLHKIMDRFHEANVSTKTTTNPLFTTTEIPKLITIKVASTTERRTMSPPTISSTENKPNTIREDGLSTTINSAVTTKEHSRLLLETTAPNASVTKPREPLIKLSTTAATTRGPTDKYTTANNTDYGRTMKTIVTKTNEEPEGKKTASTATSTKVTVKNNEFIQTDTIAPTTKVATKVTENVNFDSEDYPITDRTAFGENYRLSSTTAGPTQVKDKNKEDVTTNDDDVFFGGDDEFDLGNDRTHEPTSGDLIKIPSITTKEPIGEDDSEFSFSEDSTIRTEYPPESITKISERIPIENLDGNSSVSTQATEADAPLESHTTSKPSAFKAPETTSNITTKKQTTPTVVADITTQNLDASFPSTKVLPVITVSPKPSAKDEVVVAEDKNVLISNSLLGSLNNIPSIIGKDENDTDRNIGTFLELINIIPNTIKKANLTNDNDSSSRKVDTSTKVYETTKSDINLRVI